MSTFTGTAPELLEPWVTKIFFNEYTQVETMFDKVFNVKSSTRAFEDTFAVSGLGTFVMKPEGTPISYDDPVQSGRKRIVHSTYALGFRVTMEMMDDEQHGIISQMPADLGNSARDHKEQLAWSLLNDAFTGTTYTGIPEGDGTRRALCSTGHIRLKDGGTSSNRLNPDVAFSVSGLESALTNMRLTVDDSGRYIRIMPKMVLAHPNEEWNIAQIMESEKEPFTADNQINSVKSSRVGLTSMVVPYLSDTDNWFLMCDKSGHTLTWYNRMKMSFGRNKDAQTKDALFDAMYRASVTFDMWRGVVGSAP